MNMLLSEPEHRQLREILLEAFNRGDLEVALKESEPSREFVNIVTDSAFTKQVFELIDLAENEGWIGDLVKILDQLPVRLLDIPEHAKSANATSHAVVPGGTYPGIVINKLFFCIFAVACDQGFQPPYIDVVGRVIPGTIEEHCKPFIHGSSCRRISMQRNSSCIQLTGASHQQGKSRRI
jgi:hypothetical protein